jgi:hypothetical protein
MRSEKLIRNRYAVLQTDVRNCRVLFLKQRNGNSYPTCLTLKGVSANVIMKNTTSKSKSMGMKDLSYPLKIINIHNIEFCLWFECCPQLRLYGTE